MPGPHPKDPAIRQRRNRSVTAGALDSERRILRRPPSLPKRDAGAKEWHALTRAWWRDIYRSPMAAKWFVSDRHGLYILAELVDRFWYAPSTQLAGEIRLWSARYGEAPVDRWRLQWGIVEAPPAARSHAPNPGAGPAEDPRKVLAMVPR